MVSKTTIKSEIACLKVEQRAIEKGAIVSKPTIECPYDRVIDFNGRICRVQVKYGNSSISSSKGSFGARLDRVGRKKSNRKTYTSSEIDVVIVYSPVTGKVYWFEKEHWENKVQLVVRIKPAKNGQTKGCKLASDFEW